MIRHFQSEDRYSDWTVHSLPHTHSLYHRHSLSEAKKEKKAPADIDLALTEFFLFFRKREKSFVEKKLLYIYGEWTVESKKMGFFDRIFGSQRQKKPSFEHVKEIG